MKSTSHTRGAGLVEIERIYSTRYRDFLRVAHALVGDRDTARSVVHEAFVGAVRRRSMHTGSPQIEQRLWRVVLHTASARSAGAHMSADAARVRALIAQLPVEQRNVLCLREFGGLDNVAVGAVTYLNPEQVDDAVAAARSTLTMALGNNLKEAQHA
jgi:DNA-directed RNA polymerase specialized sigma24 family protein